MTTTSASAHTHQDRSAVDVLISSLSAPPMPADSPDVATETAAFNLSVRHHPDLVVPAACAADVAAAVRYASAAGIPVAVQGTGHGAVAPVEGGILITTHRMQDLCVDPVSRVARVGAGVKWARVIEAAAPYGLAPLSGSSSDVGAVGYTLGGGLGPLGRRHGFSADHVRSIEIVTGDGRARTVTAEDDPDLFWGLRGGKGNFGIVTAMEVDLLPVSTLYAGGIFYPGEHAATVLHRWRTWVDTLPEAASSSVALVRLPDAPDVPPPLRGTLSVHLRFALSEDLHQGPGLLAPMRTVAPVIADMVREMPFAEMDSVHMDPPDPVPFWETGRLLRELPAEAVDALVATAGPGVDVPLILVELRHLGGALARPAAVPNAVAGRDAAFSVFVLGPMAPGLEAAVPAAAGAVVDALAPYETGSRLVNFLGSTTDPAAVAGAWSAEDAARLVALKRRYDPHHLFRFGHALPHDTTPATPDA
jgi:FAD/FMN-containing dehydrogenase